MILVHDGEDETVLLGHSRSGIVTLCTFVAACAAGLFALGPCVQSAVLGLCLVGSLPTLASLATAFDDERSGRMMFPPEWEPYLLASTYNGRLSFFAAHRVIMWRRERARDHHALVALLNSIEMDVLSDDEMFSKWVELESDKRR